MSATDYPSRPTPGEGEEPPAADLCPEHHETETETWHCVREAGHRGAHWNRIDQDRDQWLTADQVSDLGDRDDAPAPAVHGITDEMRGRLPHQKCDRVGVHDEHLHDVAPFVCDGKGWSAADLAPAPAAHDGDGPSCTSACAEGHTYINGCALHAAQADQTHCCPRCGATWTVDLTNCPHCCDPDRCCDMHSQHCEPPSELCCDRCTEAAHYTFPLPHADGSACVLAAPAVGAGPEAEVTSS